MPTTALKPLAREMIDEGRALGVEYLKHLFALDAMRLFLPRDLEMEVDKLGAFSAETDRLSIETRRKWLAAIEALKSDADAPMPDLAGG